ncbi:MAG: hypothetical protein AB1782_12215 [Cyanobacteriota bacterium]
MKKILVIICSSILIFTIITLSSLAETVSLPLKADQISKNCKLTNSIDVNKDALGNFEKKFGAKVISLRNDFFSVEGNKLQINYIKSTDSANTLKVYNSLIKISGNYNVIALKNNTVIEIISPEIKTKDKIIELINPTEVHKNY